MFIFLWQTVQETNCALAPAFIEKAQHQSQISPYGIMVDQYVSPACKNVIIALVIN
jgi:hypothetical protein